jgi:hypothetical protein
VPLSATELEVLVDLTDHVRRLTVQIRKINLELKAVRMMACPPLSASEDTLRALISLLDIASANEMVTDRPSVADIDSVDRRLRTLRRAAR